MVQSDEPMLIPCVGGTSSHRLVRYPPPFEMAAADGMYVLEDDGPPELWVYRFIATSE